MTTHLLEFSKGSVELNDEQFRVVTSLPTENQRILASAGSGKTTTITARIAYLIEEYGFEPSRILLVSFSRSAAQEMIHRVHRLIGYVNLYAGTFHALSSQILREQAPSRVRDQPFIDELPYRLVKWLQTDQGIAWSKRFRTIIVDEFQDINEIQWQILKGCYHTNTTMTIVGDDAQNIYTWRGSSVDFILNFHEQLEHVQDYQLCRNYRSVESIVTIANSVMRFIPTLPFKEKMMANTKGGRKPEVHYFFRSADEWDWIVHSLDKMLKQLPDMTFAVLSRYNSDLFRIEERLHLKGIPYKLCTSYSPDSISPTKKRITLATIHASKGLEWDVVFFMNLHDDIFPARKSDHDIVCERRLFYVGVTRAKKALYLTYSKQERSLSRFVREIPRPFLRYHNVASFKLSTIEGSTGQMRIDDMLRGLDGADWNRLRDRGDIPVIEQQKTESIFQFGQFFSLPEWVKTHDVRETWFEMLRLVTLRECALFQNKLHELCTPDIQEGLLTLRIYREDFAFWEQHEAEFEHLVRVFMKHTTQMPAIEYDQLEQYVHKKLTHLQWTTQEMCHALMILAKIRGQLRPLRHKGYDLDEFSFGVVRNSVPTELRPDVLVSWHHMIDPVKKTHEIMGDMWRLAAMPSVIEGRNIPLYQYVSIIPLVQQEEQQTIVHALSKALPIWMATQENPSFHFLFEVNGIRPIQFDILTEKCAYDVFFDPNFVPSNEDKMVLLLKQYVYEETFDRALDSIGFLNVATGLIIQYEVSSTIREQLSHLWQYLEQKYHLLD
jgi:hypothetical protein